MKTTRILFRNVGLLTVLVLAGCGKEAEDGEKPGAWQARMDKLAATQKSADELCYQIRYSDDPNKITEMLDAGASLSSVDKNGFTPLITAVLPGSGGSEETQAKIVDLLLARGADPNQGCPLGAAAQSSKTVLVKKLLDKGADINGKDPLGRSGRTPLMEAVDAQSVETVTLLLEKGAKTDLKERRGLNAWKMAFDKAYSFPSVDTMKVEELVRRRTNRADIENQLRADTSLKGSVDVEKWLKSHP